MSDTYVVRANGTLDVWKDSEPAYGEGFLHIVVGEGETQRISAFYAPGMWALAYTDDNMPDVLPRGRP